MDTGVGHFTRNTYSVKVTQNTEEYPLGNVNKASYFLEFKTTS